MILGIGLMTSIYISFLILPGKLQTNGYINRVTSMVLIIALLFNIDTLMDIKDLNANILFLDGTIQLSRQALLGITTIYFIALGIIMLENKYSRSLKGVSTIGRQFVSQGSKPELYLILITNLIGIVFLITSTDFLITLIAWELFNLSLYLLVSINSESEASLSAAIKYFLLSALTTGFLLLSIALLYGLTGSTHYDAIIMVQSFYPEDPRSFGSSSYFIGYWPILLMIVTFIFKLGAAPLHNWSPDLYDAIPTYITIWMAIIPKLTIIFLLIQLSIILKPLEELLILSGTLSLIIGSIGLGSQWKIKRFLTYSGISNLGFILLAYGAGNMSSCYFYTILYAISMLAIFGIILSIGEATSVDIMNITDIAGLYRQNSGISFAFTIAIFSMAAIPPLAGFYAKLLVFNSLLDLGYNSIVLIAVITSVISVSNYLSLIKVCNFDQPYYISSISISYYTSVLITFIVGGILITTLILTDLLTYFF